MQRWERLFGDLEAQLAESELGELRVEVADRTRRELARLRLADRLRAAHGQALAVRASGEVIVRGTERGSGHDWLLLAEPSGAETVLPLAALVQVTGLGQRASVPGSEGRVAGRLGLGYALRGIARDRAHVVVILTDGSMLDGTIDRVGADHLDLTRHLPGPGGSVTVTFRGLAAVRRSA